MANVFIMKLSKVLAAWLVVSVFAVRSSAPRANTQSSNRWRSEVDEMPDSVVQPSNLVRISPAQAARKRVGSRAEAVTQLMTDPTLRQLDQRLEKLQSRFSRQREEIERDDAKKLSPKRTHPPHMNSVSPKSEEKPAPRQRLASDELFEAPQKFTLPSRLAGESRNRPPSSVAPASASAAHHSSRKSRSNSFEARYWIERAARNSFEARYRRRARTEDESGQSKPVQTDSEFDDQPDLRVSRHHSFSPTSKMLAGMKLYTRSAQVLQQISKAMRTLERGFCISDQQELSAQASFLFNSFPAHIVCEVESDGESCRGGDRSPVTTLKKNQRLITNRSHDADCLVKGW